MDPLGIIQRHCDLDSKAYYFLVHHGRLVARKALEVAKRSRHLSPDLQFIEEAAMLHDIGILFTNAPKIGCYGHEEYICHGYLGRELLEAEGLPRHGLVCERHVGMGITVGDIRENALPLPERDMLPESIEEKIICFADKFFSKTEHELLREKDLASVRELVRGYGDAKLRTFDEWSRLFLDKTAP